mgnify:CR=1 FL=1
MSSSVFGGSVARWLVEQHIAEDTIAFSEEHNPADDLRAYLNRLHALFCREFSEDGMEDLLASGATMSVGLLHYDAAECLWAGDSPIYVSRKSVSGYETEKITRPDHDPFGRLTNCFGAGSKFDLRQRSVRISSGDIITVASDGPAIAEQVLDGIYQKHSFSKAALEEMIRISAWGCFWDDLSIAAGQAMPAG